MPDDPNKLSSSDPGLPTMDMSAAKARPVADALLSMWSASVLNRMTILMFALFSLNALGTAIMGALAGAQWSQIDGQTKFLIVVAIATNWTGMLMAFFRTALTKIAKGESPVIDPEK